MNNGKCILLWSLCTQLFYDFISNTVTVNYNKSNVSDPYVRDVFMAKLVELPYPQLRDFIQNAINGELSAGQEKWAKDTISKISNK